MGIWLSAIRSASDPKVTMAAMIWLEVRDDARQPMATKKVPMRNRMRNTPVISPPVSGMGVLEKKLKILVCIKRGIQRQQ